MKYLTKWKSNVKVLPGKWVRHKIIFRRISRDIWKLHRIKGGWFRRNARRLIHSRLKPSVNTPLSVGYSFSYQMLQLPLNVVWLHSISNHNSQPQMKLKKRSPLPLCRWNKDGGSHSANRKCLRSREFLWLLIRVCFRQANGLWYLHLC